MRTVLVDTNLLVLLVIGLTSRPLIAAHKRTREYDDEAFSLLMDALSRFNDVMVTPHVLAETSNLIRQCPEPSRTRVGQCLAELVDRTREHAAAARDIVRQTHYLRLGLSDAGLLNAQESGAVLLTDDHGVYLASLHAGVQAIDFAHLREGLGH